MILMNFKLSDVFYKSTSDPSTSLGMQAVVSVVELLNDKKDKTNNCYKHEENSFLDFYYCTFFLFQFQ